MKFSAIVLIILMLGILSASGEPITSLEKEEINFGYVPQNGTLVGTIGLKSNVNYKFKIDKIITFCNCLELTLDSAIAPMDSIIITVTLDSKDNAGAQIWMPAVYDITGTIVARFGVRAHVIPDINSLKPIRVIPPIINASQFGNSGLSEFSLEIINTSEETIPLKLINSDATYYDLDFPVFVEPHSKAMGKIVLNAKGKSNEFANSITFEFIDSKSEASRYSIPIKRKIFKPQSK